MSEQTSINEKAAPTPWKLLPWLQLIRLPNLPTAIADVLAGYLISRDEFHSMQFGYLSAGIGVSACLYSAGMVLNDIYDVNQDRKERPGRPIPSGRIHVRDAFALAIWLISMGISFGFLLGAAGALTSIFLTASILAYDWGFKRTPFGPIFMGLCRFFNLMIGVFAARASFLDLTLYAFGDFVSLKTPLLAAAGNGIYITGVTYFARKEAGISSRLHLVLSAALMALGISFHGWVEKKTVHDETLFWSAFGLWSFFLASMISIALLNPVPRNVQRVIKSSIFGLVVLDALLVWAFVGAGISLVVLSLLVPAIFIGRRLYST